MTAEKTLLTLAILALFIFLNRTRGKGSSERPLFLFAKFLVYIFESLIFMYALFVVGHEETYWQFGGVYFITRFIGFSFGHGEYFVTGRKGVFVDEFAPADWILQKLMPADITQSREYYVNRSTLGMTLRYFIAYAVPQAIAFGFLSSWIVGVLVLLTHSLHGLAYRIGYIFKESTKYNIGLSELAAGFLNGLACSIVLWGL